MTSTNPVPVAIGTIALALALALAGSVRAATFCVHTSAELQSALQEAKLNGQDDTIRIATGNYPAPSGGFVYWAIEVFDQDDFGLDISGGWVDAINIPCLLQVQDPLQTVLDGASSEQVMRITVREHGNVSLRLLTLANGMALGSHGGGLELSSGSGFSATWTLERVAFISNQSQNGGALYIHQTSAASSARIRLINNLFVLNHATVNSGAAHVVLDGGTGIYATNNTVVDNSTDGIVGGLSIGGSGTVRFIANNNLWDNDGADLEVASGSSGYQLLHNNIGLRLGSTPGQASGNMAVQPEYQSGLFNYTPTRNSPLVDAGINPPPINLGYWYLSVRDMAGAVRRIGNVDIGAFEQDRIFANGFQSGTPF
ncbi:MAG: hypothetical protein WBW92_02265 [Rhodanobacteraceae bacterium]